MTDWQLFHAIFWPSYVAVTLFIMGVVASALPEWAQDADNRDEVGVQVLFLVIWPLCVLCVPYYAGYQLVCLIRHMKKSRHERQNSRNEIEDVEFDFKDAKKAL